MSESGPVCKPKKEEQKFALNCDNSVELRAYVIYLS